MRTWSPQCKQAQASRAKRGGFRRPPPYTDKSTNINAAMSLLENRKLPLLFSIGILHLYALSSLCFSSWNCIHTTVKKVNTIKFLICKENIRVPSLCCGIVWFLFWKNKTKHFQLGIKTVDEEESESDVKNPLKRDKEPNIWKALQTFNLNISFFVLLIHSSGSFWVSVDSRNERLNLSYRLTVGRSSLPMDNLPDPNCRASAPEAAQVPLLPDLNLGSGLTTLAKAP